MSWWGVVLVAVGAGAVGAIVGYCAALIQVGSGMNW